MRVYAYPTDTVWGIGASISDKDAHQQIEKIKGVGPGKPVSILYSSTDTLFGEFHFPKRLTKNWLRTLFQMESTLAIPKQWAKRVIPEWIVYDSPLVAIRCLELEHITRLVEQAGGPISSTSLNHSGEPPITRLNEARKFCEAYPQIELVAVDMTSSGNSSSIISLDSDLNLEFLRKGALAEEIIKHARLLSA